MKRYISSLDGLRGFGILFVVFYHLLRIQGEDSTIIGFSWIFIQMFFIQSGYLITKILIGSKEKPLKEYLKKFYWNRVLRIFPVYFSYLFILVAAYLAANITPDFLTRAPFLFTYTYNYTRLFESIDFHPLYVHLWSLSVEEQFYLIWPFFIYFISNKNLKYLIISFFIICPVVRYMLGEYLIANTSFDQERIGEAIYGFTFSHFDAFSAGGAIAIFNLENKKRFAWKALTILSGIIVVILFLNFQFSKDNYESLHWSSLGLQLANLSNLQHVWSYTLVNIFFMLLIIIIIQTEYRGIFNWKPFVSMGKVVYSTYIFHFMILLVLSRTIGNFPIPVLFLVAMASSYLVGLISYNYFEKQFLRFKY